MSSLSSASTDQEVWDAYDDNASYAEDASVSKAKSFVTACRILLRRRPTNMTVDGSTVAFSATSIERELEDAQHWLAQNNTSVNGGSVRYLDFRGLRD
jgi:hypothetical protein